MTDEKKKDDEVTGSVELEELPEDELSPEEAEEAAAEAVEKHPGGIAGGDVQLEDLPEPKPKVDLFPNHAPVSVPVKVQDLIDAGQERVEKRVQKLKEEKEARKAAREEAKDVAKEQAESRKTARVEDREERKAAANRPTQLPADAKK